METTLRLFYARAIPAVLFILVMLFALAMMAAPAFAQAVTAPAQPGILDIAATSLSAALAGVLTIGSAFVIKQLPSWMGSWLEAKATTESKDWSIYTDAAVNRAKAYAEKKLKGARDSSRYVNFVIEYLHKYEPEIIRWADKNGDGVLDFLEPWLPDHVNPKPPEAVTQMPARKVTKVAAEAKH